MTTIWTPVTVAVFLSCSLVAGLLLTYAPDVIASPGRITRIVRMVLVAAILAVLLHGVTVQAAYTTDDYRYYCLIWGWLDRWTC